jgi:hypothetical protein
LSASKDIAKKAVIVETPYAMAASRLQFIDILEFPTQLKITYENVEDQISLFVRLRFEKAYEGHTKEEDSERCFMASPVIHPQKRSK